MPASPLTRRSVQMAGSKKKAVVSVHSAGHTARRARAEAEGARKLIVPNPCSHLSGKVIWRNGIAVEQGAPAQVGRSSG
jgi:hypothetical protein